MGCAGSKEEAVKPDGLRASPPPPPPATKPPPAKSEAENSNCHVKTENAQGSLQAVVTTESHTIKRASQHNDDVEEGFKPEPSKLGRVERSNSRRSIESRGSRSSQQSNGSGNLIPLPKPGSANDPVSEEKLRSLHGGTDPGIGRAENQDAYTSFAFRDNAGIETCLQGVFDGHGPDGKKCALACSDAMKKLLDEQAMIEMQAPFIQNKSMPQTTRMPIAGSMMNIGSVSRKSSGDRWPKPQAGGSVNCVNERKAILNMPFSGREERLLHLLFFAMEANLREECNTVMSGTTGTVCMLKPGAAWVASVGDSSSLLISQEPGVSEPLVQVLAGDHRLTNDAEKQRVIDCGARVDMRKGQSKGHLRIWLPELDTPGLMVTRSLGDAIGKTIGVTSEPEVHILDLMEGDQYIVMASDGVWDVMSHDRVAAVIMENADCPENAVKQVLAESLEGWHKKKAETEARAGKAVRGIGDNITMTLVDLGPWISVTKPSL